MTVTDANQVPAYILFNAAERSLVSARRIRQGETIANLPQAILTVPDKYSLEIHPGVHVDCEMSMVGAINHSCAPNAYVKDTRIVAWNCIAPGEEITIDYKATEHKLAVPFDCKCGRLGCIGRIE